MKAIKDISRSKTLKDFFKRFDACIINDFDLARRFAADKIFVGTERRHLVNYKEIIIERIGEVKEKKDYGVEYYTCYKCYHPRFANSFHFYFCVPNLSMY